jgi:hypothetical protein
MVLFRILKMMHEHVSSFLYHSLSAVLHWFIQHIHNVTFSMWRSYHNVCSTFLMNHIGFRVRTASFVEVLQMFRQTLQLISDSLDNGRGNVRTRVSFSVNLTFFTICRCCREIYEFKKRTVCDGKCLASSFSTEAFARVQERELIPASQPHRH